MRCRHVLDGGTTASRCELLASSRLLFRADPLSISPTDRFADLPADSPRVAARKERAAVGVVGLVFPRAFRRVRKRPTAAGAKINGGG